MMRNLCILLLSLTVHIQAAKEISDCHDAANIYSNLAQVKRRIDTRKPYVFSAEQSDRLYPDIITLDNCESNCQLHVSLRQGVQTGSSVFIRSPPNIQFSTNGLAMQTSRPAVIVNPERNLVQYKDTNTYAYVDSSSIEFTEPPTKNVIELWVDQVNGSPVQEDTINISYFTRQVNWKVEHEINMPQSDAHQGNFRTYAVVKNLGSEKYCVNAAAFLTTQLDVSTSAGELMYPRFGLVGASRSIANDMHASAAQALPEELMGIRKYSLERQLNIPPKGMVKQQLFEQVEWRAENLFKRNRALYEGRYEGKLQRVIRLNQTMFVPAGQLNIKDKGWIIYRTSIPSLAPNEQYDVDLGLDPDVMVVETVSATSKNALVRNITVNIELTNHKTDGIRVEYELPVTEGVITSVTCGSDRVSQFKYDEKQAIFKVHLNQIEKLKLQVILLVDLLPRKDTMIPIQFFNH